MTQRPGPRPLLATALLLCATAHPSLAAPPGSANPLGLSQGTQELLLTEMRELEKGVQALVPAIARGDWKTIVDTGNRINASYIMAQSLTEAQRHELEQKLPGHFTILDAQFHREAERLVRAAEERDAGLAALHFYRLVDGCVNCHTSFAADRFTGLKDPHAPAAHAH
ncbi:MAG: hypothetical protein LOY58_13100 [Gammaproteobacteria bacterium]|nr:hypothetical protein [Gammaproteobacteria bacterium]